MIYYKNNKYMCGFIGFTEDCDKKKEVLSDMLQTISHRGPDSEDTYFDDGISLGFRRLSIIDIAGGSQPIFNEDKTKILVFNGEIYNYKTLRKELIAKGHKFATRSDSEVLIHGYEEYGALLLTKLRGMFSFVIWDKVEKSLFAARDFFGIKPLYYAHMGPTLLFGSEIKGFLPHPAFKKEFNENKLPDYLTFSCVPGNETFFKNVYKLPPGHYLEYKNSQLKITKYFSVDFAIDKTKDLQYFSRSAEEALTDSITAHSISDVEVGCFLSAGVDSSIVVYEVSKKSKVKTFTIGFSEKQYSEDVHAREFAKEIGVSNDTKIVSSNEYFSNLGKIQYHMDEPLANPSANLLYFLSEMASKKVKVVLSGEGADEMFGGYNVYKEPGSLRFYQKLPISFRKFLASLVEALPFIKGKNFIIRGSKTVEERYIGNSNIFSEKERTNFLLKKYSALSPQAITKLHYDSIHDADDITKMQYLDIHMWMVQEILLKADKMSMAHSLELRVPFLDKKIWSVAREIPPELKVNSHNTKLVLRDVASKKINKESTERTKMAFPVPLTEWLREEKYADFILRYFMGDVSKQFFDQEELQTLMKDHIKGRNNTRKIWTMLTFLVWYEEFFVKR